MKLKYQILLATINMISNRLIQAIARIVVVYEAVNEIIVGTFATIVSGFNIYAQSMAQENIHPFFCFMIVASILCIFKGSLFLHSIKQRKKQGILIYFVLTAVLLLIAKGFIFSEGIYAIQQLQGSDDERALIYKFRKNRRLADNHDVIETFNSRCRQNCYLL
ncbi:uncharacterized protein LOC135140912 [Zophobas morio]|uniref:uncharacterized protein LOC135140912 n=1 Tax=Zophobas morio TaxID=2755281 RepID=UPI0030828F67